MHISTLQKREKANECRLIRKISVMGLKKEGQITGYEHKKQNRATTMEIQPSQ